MPTLRDAMTASASALDVQRARLEVAVSNIANAESTTGVNGGPYRRREVLLEAVASGDGEASAGGFGVRVAAIVEDQSPFQRRFDPSHAQADETGHIELPNVDVPTEMVDMLGAARAYQANLAAISLIRETVQKALEIGRG
jgi:flagellar basal-body rod protein FlgC